MKTYDIHFNDSENGNCKGFKMQLKEAVDYVIYSAKEDSYYNDYKGGVISIVCNETGETIHEEEII